MAHILLVDDEESLRGLLKRGLELDGHQVDVAIDGGDGLDRLRDCNGAFDLLVSDIRMPGMDGIALAHNAKAEYPAVPILLMTGYAEQAAMNPQFLGGRMELLVKPFDAQALVNKVHAVMGLGPAQ